MPLSRLHAAVSAQALALALTGCAMTATTTATTTAITTSTSAATSAESAKATESTTADATSAVAARVEPVEVNVPKIAARSSLIPLGLNADDTVEVPPVSEPMQAGWYVHARAPGEPGPAIILGHVDGDSRPGIFHRLRELAVGDEVEVSRADGSTLTFRVDQVEQVAKERFPTDAVYGDTPEPELRLITCGGTFDRTGGSYLDNIIVYAQLI
ncbi:class F sortase [Actinosynnema sp. NPDC050801]|uniref:class F sortase n=1 Tax=unclassified Actinosynnema TaxID=2637065 RepID=UPI0033F2994D